jgi:hypothetical protein
MTLAINKSLETKIAPYGLPTTIHGARYPERRMLVWDDVIFIFGVWRLVLGRDVDVFDGEEGGDCCWGG